MEPSEETPQAKHHNSTDGDILIVDGDAEAARRLSDALMALGVSAGHVSDTQSGLAIAKTLRPELVLADVDAPGAGGGCWLSKVLTRLDYTAKVILLYSDANAFERATAYDDHGALSLFRKPLSTVDLESLVKAFFPDRKRK